MPLQTYEECLTSSAVDGATITATGTTPQTCIPANNVLTLPANFWQIGKTMRITAMGRLSCAVTTPGTARWQVRMGPTATISTFDTGAMGLNIVAKTTLPWLLQIWMTCRATGSGTSANFMGIGQWQSETVVGSAVAASGGNGTFVAPVTTPAVGAGFDSTVANQLDLWFTQTVNTGSMTVHQYIVEVLN